MLREKSYKSYYVNIANKLTDMHLHNVIVLHNMLKLSDNLSREFHAFSPNPRKPELAYKILVELGADIP